MITVFEGLNDMNVKYSVFRLGAFLVGVMLLLALAQLSATATVPMGVTVPSAPVAESRDFATLVLRDPWDMSQFTDISQYLNESAQRSIIQNPVVANGIFTATSVYDVGTGDSNAYFFPLFPGYQNSIQAGKLGENYPIDATTYHCLYVAMKVNSGPANVYGPDQWRVLWFADSRLNGSGGVYGITNGIALYPEAGAGQPSWSWRLYQIDLASPDNGMVPGTAAWNSRTNWQGLRIDPTINAPNITFQVDWVRLTNCSSNRQTITWTPNGSITAVWVRPSGTTNYIRVATGIAGASGSYNLDTQGLAPGSYYIGLGTNTTCCIQESTSPLVINQTPIVYFDRPSFITGTDYATQAGNPWDFSDSSDVTQLVNFQSTSFTNGVLDMVTASGPPPGGIDAQIHLNTPQSFYTSSYRYLSFRIFTEWARPWQDPPDGMTVRWIYTIPKSEWTSRLRM
jgi:hypothetical protein